VEWYAKQQGAATPPLSLRNIIPLKQLERLKPADEAAILNFIEVWNSSNARRTLAILVEYVGFLCLQILVVDVFG
jgi:hypothetical protein